MGEVGILGTNDCVVTGRGREEIAGCGGRGVWIFGLCGRSSKGLVCVPSFSVDFCWGSDELDNCSAAMWGKERGREVKEKEQTHVVT